MFCYMRNDLCQTSNRKQQYSVIIRKNEQIANILKLCYRRVFTLSELYESIIIAMVLQISNG